MTTKELDTVKEIAPVTLLISVVLTAVFGYWLLSRPSSPRSYPTMVQALVKRDPTWAFLFWISFLCSVGMLALSILWLL